MAVLRSICLQQCFVAAAIFLFSVFFFLIKTSTRKERTTLPRKKNEWRNAKPRWCTHTARKESWGEALCCCWEIYELISSVFAAAIAVSTVVVDDQQQQPFSLLCVIINLDSSFQRRRRRRHPHCCLFTRLNCFLFFSHFSFLPSFNAPTRTAEEDADDDDDAKSIEKGDCDARINMGKQAQQWWYVRARLLYSLSQYRPDRWWQFASLPSCRLGACVYCLSFSRICVCVCVHNRSIDYRHLSSLSKRYQWCRRWAQSYFTCVHNINLCLHQSSSSPPFFFNCDLVTAVVAWTNRYPPLPPLRCYLANRLSASSLDQRIGSDGPAHKNRIE